MRAAWEEIEQTIWECKSCAGHPRAILKIRQQTPEPLTDVKLLIVGIAPPYRDVGPDQVVAQSATNYSNDTLRKFIEETLALPWIELQNRGLVVLHAVKCAILPKNGYQNPPNEIVDICSSNHFAREFLRLRPAEVITLGRVALRAIANLPGLLPHPTFRLSMPLHGSFTLQHGDTKFHLTASRFIRSDTYKQAQHDLKTTAARAGISSGK